MKKILSYMLLSAILLNAGVSENSYTKEEFEAIDERSGEEIAKIWAENEIKNLPKKQDEFTTLTNVIAINKKIYYTKEINAKKNELLKKLLSTEENRKKLINDLYKESREKLCKKPLDRAYFDKKDLGFQIDYYTNKNKEYIGSYSIDKSDCIKLEQEEKSKGKYSLH